MCHRFNIGPIVDIEVQMVFLGSHLATTTQVIEIKDTLASVTDTQFELHEYINITIDSSHNLMPYLSIM